MVIVKKSKCQSCHQTFELSNKQINLVTDLLNRGQKFIMLECSLCGLATNYQQENDDIQNSAIEVDSYTYRCPVSHCTGWVELIEDSTSSFFGCGECGSIWHEEQSFQKEITQIVSLYNYRAKCYKMIENKWTPSPLENEDKNYETLVESEPFDKKKSFTRD